jgi:hypothetical protein
MQQLIGLDATPGQICRYIPCIRKDFCWWAQERTQPFGISIAGEKQT